MSDTNPNPNPNPNPNEPTAGSADPHTKQERTFSEEFRVSGEAVLSKVKELVREGNVRRITIKNEEGRTLIEIPLTIGVIGTVLLPVWAAIGAVAALVANLTIGVERVRPVDPSPNPSTDIDGHTGPGPV